MELKVINDKGQSGANLSVSDAVFGREFNQDLVHQLVTAYMANARSGNSKQKSRCEIAKSTHKPFAQKGTGRARAGMASSPLWRGGGKIFPNTGEENYSQKINRKMYRAGVATILSKLVSDDRLVVIDDLSVEAPKTKLLMQKIKSLGLDSGRLLIITDKLDENLYLSSRNLPNVLVLEAHQADPVSLVRFPSVIVTRGAVAKIEEMFA
ncbi:MAG: 50S ribosomal protein L4 [Gallionellales bacterium CG_4_10_14_3_um_filter_54_96]|nr:MAG: 50S ribosomal protein L4 [Gallionellaceae bacterium CG1_02_56_997]PIV14675.1 MAG: 50S ribosomal protein L4 [Gallionellales bacterium CG03_land_8_20_14_0_80_55_15]PIV91196.1 MAG: 50S ribosomal protein L4 [Gallionellales bacterium CG17_big_fil_post_rev_8_21_14_2_50_54_146]PIX03924.1 MAG: 50S ribosomal protein L4 [Gallionellales bacterium CG_4_8_14_3_um_filter_54_18]PIY06387.1 MAG: 50S ribosomal protein L4 [Gallionellales bacterium CG_4_10_14_3_um_filter_54_96]HCJ51018.1 50S ribosomal pro